MKPNIYNLVLKIFRDIDPLGLIEMGAPYDEYDAEALEVLKFILKKTTPDEMRIGIKEIFKNKFEDEPDESVLSELITKIKDVIHTSK